MRASFLLSSGPCVPRPRRPIAPPSPRICLLLSLFFRMLSFHDRVFCIFDTCYPTETATIAVHQTFYSGFVRFQLFTDRYFYAQVNGVGPQQQKEIIVVMSNQYRSIRGVPEQKSLERQLGETWHRQAAGESDARCATPGRLLEAKDLAGGSK